MAQEVNHVLVDMLVAIERTEEVTSGLDVVQFLEDWRAYWIVQRGLEIISEASRAIPPEMKEVRAEIPWRQVAAFGNVLRHEYDGLSPNLIWATVTEHLPPLKLAIIALREGNS